MALKRIDHRKMGEPLPDSHPLSKGALIGFGGLRSQAAASKSKLSLEEDEQRAFEQRQYGQKHGKPTAPLKDSQDSEAQDTPKK